MKLGAIAATAVVALAPIVPTAAHADAETADALAQLFAMRADLLGERDQAIVIGAAGIEARHLARVKKLGYEPGTTDPREIARQMAMNKYNWGADQFACYNNIIIRESNWIVTADNPHSSAYGIPQALPGKKMASFGADWRTNPVTQIKWGLGYIASRYGSPCSAWSHSVNHNWY